jgi:hypothetical protein
VQVLLEAEHFLADREGPVKVNPAVRLGGRKRIPAAHRSQFTAPQVPVPIVSWLLMYRTSWEASQRGESSARNVEGYMAREDHVASKEENGPRAHGMTLARANDELGVGVLSSNGPQHAVEIEDFGQGDLAYFHHVVVLP